MDVTREQLAWALEGFALEVETRHYGKLSGGVADPGNVAGRLLALAGGTAEDDEPDARPPLRAVDPEAAFLTGAMTALNELDSDARQRAVRYLVDRYHVDV